MSEGSLEAPTRHNIPWKEKDYLDPKKIDNELRRVFDVCHGCRRCFNLCDSFPRLFDLIDDSDSEELDTVESKDFKPIVDACTFCDMCFMTKCPYVPPHEFDLDFPHLMLRYRAMEFDQGKVAYTAKQITKTDRNGSLASPFASLVNWSTRRQNKITRSTIEKVAKIHRDAELPKFTSTPLTKRTPLKPASEPKRKVALYATCFGNYNNPSIGDAMRAVLAKNNVEVELVYPACCGMPQLEQGDLKGVAESAKNVASELVNWIKKGYEIVALIPSCALMLKFEWPLVLPDDENVKLLSQNTFDAAEYIVHLAKNGELSKEMVALDGSISLQLACHSRAQNMGPKAAEMLRLIPETRVEVVERCSGHGGSWGIMKENFEVALKVGRPAARKALESKAKYIVSECPLAREHIIQGIEKLNENNPENFNKVVQHPIQILALAYGIK